MKNNLTLALTKIGDLLINNKIALNSGKESLENITLHIPEYQRSYKWKSKNVNQLLDDITEAKNANKEVYRAGTLILHHNEEKECYDIVDGQQRTISFALMLRCLYEHSSGIPSSSTISFLDQKVSDNSFNRRNIPNNYNTLKRRIERFSETENNDMISYVENRCELIVVITDDVSEAFQFFDSQNARGKALYPHDLLKAYHLREMDGLSTSETEKAVNVWEELDQKILSQLFSDYLYRLKEWIKGNRPTELNEHNIDVFKGVSSRDNYPFAQYYKGAYAYADQVNNSYLPFVTGSRKLKPFQLDSPIIAGKPFFDFAKHYFDLLADIRNNDKYEGSFINDNEIVKTLNLKKYREGTGNIITKLLFDTALILYIDRFCPEDPDKTDREFLEQFLVYAFIWAYSLRAQYENLGWFSAQNYILGTGSRTDIANSFNIYKVIINSDSPISLLSDLANRITPISQVKTDVKEINAEENGIKQNYMYYFKKYNYWGSNNDK